MSPGVRSAWPPFARPATIVRCARVAKSVAARDLKSLDRKVIPVRVRARAPVISIVVLVGERGAILCAMVRRFGARPGPVSSTTRLARTAMSAPLFPGVASMSFNPEALVRIDGVNAVTADPAEDGHRRLRDGTTPGTTDGDTKRCGLPLDGSGDLA